MRSAADAGNWSNVRGQVAALIGSAATSARVRVLRAGGGLAVSDVRCGYPESRYEQVVATGLPVLRIVRRGAFQRRTRDGAVMVDTGFASFAAPDRDQEFAHPRDGGDDTTLISLSRDLLDELTLDESQLPQRPVVVDSETRRTHGALWRVLHASGAEWEELALGLFVDLLGSGRTPARSPGRAVTADGHRRVADAAREALLDDPTLSLLELGRLLGCSPHHLSRVFRAQTGTTISAHKLRLRVRAAHARVAAGEQNLARLAAELGFADHSHLTRAMVADSGETPSAVRQGSGSL